MLIESKDNTNTYHLTTAEAVAMIKKAPTGSRFAISFRRDAPVLGEPGTVYRDGCSSYLNVGRKEFLRIAKDCLSDVLEAKGARIELRTNHYPETTWRKASTTYWL